MRARAAEEGGEKGAAHSATSGAYPLLPADRCYPFPLFPYLNRLCTSSVQGCYRVMTRLNGSTEELLLSSVTRNVGLRSPQKVHRKPTQHRIAECRPGRRWAKERSKLGKGASHAWQDARRQGGRQGGRQAGQPEKPHMMKSFEKSAVSSAKPELCTGFRLSSPHFACAIAHRLYVSSCGSNFRDRGSCSCVERWSGPHERLEHYRDIEHAN